MRALLAALLLAPGAAWADFNSDARGTTGGGFLELGAGARAAGLGGAFSAAADDATALYWNPAGLTRVAEPSATLMHAPYLGSTYFDYGAYAQKLGGGALGVGVQYLNAGSLDQTDDTGVGTGTFSPHDLALTVGYARPVGGASFGLSAKYISSTILASAQTAAVDAGVLSGPLLEGKLRLAATMTNLGGGLKYENESSDLPLAFRLGSAYKLGENLLAVLDLVFAKNDRPNACVGAEYRGQAGTLDWAARAGYDSRTAGDVDGLTGFSFGLGAGKKGASLDYAFVPFGKLGLTHRLSLTLRLGGS